MRLPSDQLLELSEVMSLLSTRYPDSCCWLPCRICPPVKICNPIGWLTENIHLGQEVHWIWLRGVTASHCSASYITIYETASPPQKKKILIDYLCVYLDTDGEKIFSIFRKTLKIIHLVCFNEIKIFLLFSSDSALDTFSTIQSAFKWK